MSEDSKPPEAPAPASAPGSTPAQPSGTTPAQPVATPSTAPLGSRPPGPPAVSPSNPPIDILLPAPKKPFSIPPYAGCLVKMIFGFFVLLIMGYCALVALSPKAQKWATQGAKDGSGGPTPFNTLNQILAIPAQAIGKTKDVVAKSDARVGVLDNVIATDDKKSAKSAKPLTDPFGSSTPAAGAGHSAARAAGAAEDGGGNGIEGKISREALLAKAARDTAETAAKPKTAPARPVATAPPPPPGPPELKFPGGITITNSSPAGTPPASAPFMYWAAGLNISGVSNNTPPRFLMNGKLVREGDEVNRQLGVSFDHLDTTAKLIYFRDKNGALVTRSY